MTDTVVFLVSFVLADAVSLLRLVVELINRFAFNLIPAPKKEF